VFVEGHDTGTIIIPVGTFVANSTFQFRFVKGKIAVVNTINTCDGVKVSLHSFLTSTLQIGGQHYAMWINPGERAPLSP
jgi:hypothetical protein